MEKIKNILDYVGKTIKRLSWVLLIILASMVVVECSENKQLREDNSRLKDNQTALSQSINAYKLSDSTAVAKINVLTLEKDEFREMYLKEVLALQKANIKVKRLQNLTTTELTHNYVFDTIKVTDTLIITSDKNLLTAVKKFAFEDDYVKLSGLIDSNNVTDLTIKTYDTILTAVHKEYKKRFLFIKWKPYLTATIISKNPYSEITNGGVVEVK